MAQQTKKTTAKNSSAKKRTVKKSSGAKKAQAAPAKRTRTEAEINQLNTILGILFLAAALLSFLCFFEGLLGPVGHGLKIAMSWTLGAMSVGVPALFLLLAGAKFLGKSKPISRKGKWILLLFWCVDLFWTTVTVPLNGMGFTDYLTQLTKLGVELSGGGAASFPAWILVSLLHPVGSVIVLIVAMLILIVIISGVNFANLFAPKGAPEEPEETVPSHSFTFRKKGSDDPAPAAEGSEQKKHKFVIPDVTPEEQLSPAERRKWKLKQQEREKELNSGSTAAPSAETYPTRGDASSSLPGTAKKRNDFDFSEDLLKTPQQIEDEAQALMEQEKELLRQEEAATMTREELRTETAKVALEAQKSAEKEIPYVYPPLSLLSFKPDENAAHAREEMKQTAASLMQALEDFNVDTTYLDAVRGPTVTRYELQPNAGVKISKITRLSDDIALHLAASGVRIEAPIPGRSAIGIEIPNKQASVVYLKETISSDAFRNHKSNIAVALGKDITGQNVCIDLAKMPHLLIAGSTGSGKSVCINTILISLLYKSSPDQVKLILVDPKVVELSSYNGIPHLLIPVVTSAKQAAGALQWAVTEMLQRYKLFAEKNVRNYQGYNEKLAEGEKPMPQIVIVIDELADLMMAAPGEVEDAICRLAQMARAAGMHLIIATQRPSADVLTGLIKTNVPSRIAFAVSSQIDSRIILDQSGAEKLIGRGDMLYNPLGASKPMRIQGCFVSDSEVESVVEFIKQHSGEQDAEAQSKILNEVDKLSNQASAKGKKGITGGLPGGTDADGDYVDDGDDVLLPRAVEMVISQGMASTSGLQRSLGVGHSRAGRIMDQMEKKGYIGPYQGSKPREVLITQEQWNELRTTQTEGSQDE